MAASSPSRPKALNNPLTVLRFGSVFVLFGWSLMHLFWAPPYSSYLISQEWAGPVAENLLGMSWEAYARSETVERVHTLFIRAIGLILLSASAVSLLVPKKARALRFLLPLALFHLILLALALHKESGFQAGMLIEHAAQVATPLLFYLTAFQKMDSERLFVFVRVAIALTFFGHGLYAIGYYPVPGKFIDMTLTILPVSEAQAVLLLRGAGIMDFLVALGVFIPRLCIPALTYATVWGLLTSLARPMTQIFLESGGESLAYGIIEGIYRVPHFALPFAALLLASKVPVGRPLTLAGAAIEMRGTDP